MTIRTFAEFDSDLPTDAIESGADFIQYPGKSVTEAVRGILAELGCVLDRLEYLHEKGWEFEFAYRDRRIVCRLTLIWRYLAIFEDLRGSKAADHPDFVAIMERLADALAADARFTDVGWFHRQDFEPHQSAAEAPGAGRPAEGLAPPPQLAGQPWSDLSPYPFRRWSARLFDFYVVVTAPMILCAKLLSVPVRDAVDVLMLLLLLLPVRIVVSVLLDAALLSWTSTTPGKWLCGVRIVAKDGEAVTFGRAFKREVEAVIAGCGLWFPLIDIAAIGYNGLQLTEKGETSWDRRRGLMAVQRPNTWGQFLLTLLTCAPPTTAWIVLMQDVGATR